MSEQPQPADATGLYQVNVAAAGGLVVAAQQAPRPATGGFAGSTEGEYDNGTVTSRSHFASTLTRVDHPQGAISTGYESRFWLLIHWLR